MLDNKTLQQALKLTGHYVGQVDGRVGPKSQVAVMAILSEYNIGSSSWPAPRRQVAAFQAAMQKLGYEPGKIDGLEGPQTRNAMEDFQEFLVTGKRPTAWRQDYKQPTVQTTSAWPRGSLEMAMNKYYGAVGTNQTKLALPWPMRIAWDKGSVVNSITCHEKVHDSALWVFDAIANEYDASERTLHGFDLFGGCLNVRRVRGGTAWSVHSWGAAFDFDPERNQLKWGRDKAYFAKTECDRYRAIWKEAGALSLGETRNYDWMHFQFAQL